MKKRLVVVLVAIALVVSCVVSLIACADRKVDLNEVTMPAYDVPAIDYSDLEFDADFKIGLICLHDENSTYDKNFIDAMLDTQAKFGLSNEQVIIATGIGEDESCYNKAVELALAGCDVIFADSFGHEKFMVQAAREYPNVQFAHATGTQALVLEGVDNYSNGFASIYEGRYLAGVAAGMKLNEMIAAGEFTADEAKIGYVGAYTYAEVISGYTSFYLGAKSICPTVTMEVSFTGSWYDEQAEKQTAINLINRGCKLISQHADSMGAPNACEEKNVPNVSYNGSTLAACTDTFIISSRINWSPYYEYVIASVRRGNAVAKNWVGTIQTGSVVLSNLGGNAMAEGTVEKLVDVRNKLINGTLHVFDASTFTVTIRAAGTNGPDDLGLHVNATLDGNNHLTAYLADVEDKGDYIGETNVIKSANEVTFFSESEFRSAPYFDLQIDGITLLNSKF